MEKRSIIVSFGGQKGGTGKTFNATALASYVHEKTDYSIVLVDADDKQRSVHTRREKEVAGGLIPKGHEPFPIQVYSSAEAGEKILKNQMGLYDFIFVDFPGTLSQEGVTGAYAFVDLIIIPVDVVSVSEVDSTIQFSELLVTKIDPFRVDNGFPESEKFFLFNKTDSRLNEFKDIGETKRLKSETPFPTLNNMLPYWVDFKRDWQTYSYPTLDDKKQAALDALTGEMFEKIVAMHKKLN